MIWSGPDSVQSIGNAMVETICQWGGGSGLDHAGTQLEEASIRAGPR